MMKHKQRLTMLIIPSLFALEGCTCTPTPISTQEQAQVQPTENVLSVTDNDEILWNGIRVSEEALVELLGKTSEMSPEPALRFEPDALANYELSARVLGRIKDSGVTKFGFVGNERYIVDKRSEP